MKKKLYYFLHVKDNINDNIGYYINKICLSQNINVFDELYFYITLDDLSNHNLRAQALNWINDVTQDKPFEVKFAKSSPYFEAVLLKEEIVDKINNFENELVFFAHSKGINQFKYENKTILSYHSDINMNGILTWIASLYYFSFKDMKEIEKNLFGGDSTIQECFYGPLLCQDDIIDTKYKCDYVGTFYWLNPMELSLRLTQKKSDASLLKLSNRYFAENFPGNMCGRTLYGDGLAGPNNGVASTFVHYDVYHMDKDLWTNLLGHYGKIDECWEYITNVVNQAYDEFNKIHNTQLKASI